MARRTVPVDDAGNEVSPTKALKGKGRGRRKRGAAVAVAEVVPPEDIVDEGLVEEAVHFINKKVGEIQTRFGNALVEIGAFVLDKFFDNDPSRVEFRGRQKRNSFRALSEREDLSISKSHLHNAVSLSIQHKLLLEQTKVEPKLLAEAPSTHQVMLLPIKDLKRKARLLQEVVDEGLTVRQLEQRIKMVPGVGNTHSKGDAELARTRIPKPLLSFVGLDLQRLTNPERLARLGKRDITAYRKTLEDAADRIKQLGRALDAATG